MSGTCQSHGVLWKWCQEVAGKRSGYFLQDWRQMNSVSKQLPGPRRQQHLGGLSKTDGSAVLKVLRSEQKVVGSIKSSARRSLVTAAEVPSSKAREPEPCSGQTVAVMNKHRLLLRGNKETLEPSPPTAAQIRYVLFHNALPFVGFGFLDNAIMIAAGTQIELSIGVTLGISTMAGKKQIKSESTSSSPGTVSCLKASYVEALASKLGMQVPDLTPKQVDMWQTRLSSHMGKGIGVSIGCILGMFPLFFLGDDDEKEKEKEAEPPADTSDSS
ncbi:Transmembrane protein 65 [Collichthys lucidus]|uniref:Transmembrane protein 65 n=1 Tax=Collichthys lucidus TaxID=240159 RepID=A0A4U5VL71_COLLU|nr:Transmembrane protein 65 [Collichthys lucidus]